jgi:hypothetical protein
MARKNPGPAPVLPVSPADVARARQMLDIENMLDDVRRVCALGSLLHSALAAAATQDLMLDEQIMDDAHFQLAKYFERARTRVTEAVDAMSVYPAAAEVQ